MKKVYFSSFKNNESQVITYSKDDIKDLNNINYSSDIKEFLKVEGEIIVTKVDDVLQFDFENVVTMTAISTISLKEFTYKMNLSDTLYFTKMVELESEEVFLEDKEYVDLDYYLYSLIVTSLPFNIHEEGEKYPESSEFKVYSEDELEEELNKEASSPFDILSDLDLDE